MPTTGKRVALVLQDNFADDAPRPLVLMAYEGLNTMRRAMNVALVAREAGESLEMRHR